MRHLWFAGLICCLGAGNPAVADPLPSAGAWATTTFNVAGQSRQTLAYRPSAANPPMLVFFSGTGATVEYNTADEIGRLALAEWAERQGVALLFPLPRVMTRGDWDNHNADTPYWETASAEGAASPPSTTANPDLALVHTLLDAARNDWAVDTQRVYVAGFSNGAFFSYFVAQQLADRIAGFAATGGGLVLSGTTAGEPPCRPPVVAANPGQVRSCIETGWSAGVCNNAGAVPHPIAPGARLPAAFLEANDDDTSVPYAHTCNLAQHIPANTPTQVRIVHAGGGHIVNAGFLDNAWAFLQSHRLTTSSNPSDADRLFNWAEARYANLFAPPGQVSQSGAGYYFRYYPGTFSYLGVNNGQIFYLSNGGVVQGVGTLNDYLGAVAADGY